VLRAETVPVASWAALPHMAQHAGLRLSLVVQGRPPNPDQTGRAPRVTATKAARRDAGPPQPTGTRRNRRALVGPTV
jgi:hypothetical protein